jgi:hypothetical protein
LWKDEYREITAAIRNRFQKDFRSEDKSVKKAGLFQWLCSDDETTFFCGVFAATHMMSKILTEKDKEKIRNIVLRKRHLFRNSKLDIFGFSDYDIKISQWFDLCYMLDIEPTQEEIELWEQVTALPEELQRKKERAERHRELMNKVFPINDVGNN